MIPQAGGDAVRRRLILIYVGLVAGNLGAWAWALLALRGHPALIGMAALAYLFGLRHAVDADHIAAIDNVTRKLVQQGRRPISVGLNFSLGHATVVIIACALVAAGSRALRADLDAFRAYGGVIGTAISGGFLFLIALANLITLAGLYRRFRHRDDAAGVGKPLASPSGLLSRILAPLMHLISKSWHMYPLGLLFGLGFDTASEIALLGLSASQASQHMPMLSIMIFPALFTAGMAWVDTTDAVLMVSAYGWALIRPARKLVYNMTVTLVSVAVALIVGGLEILGLVADRISLRAGAWRVLAEVNSHFTAIGLTIIIVLIGSWIASMLAARVRPLPLESDRGG